MAAPIGNPADPSVLEEGFWIADRCWSSLRAGVTGDLLFLKRLRPCHRMHHLGICQPEMNWQLAVSDIGWNIQERFNFHFLVGPVASIGYQWRQHAVAYAATSSRGLFWGASSKLILLEAKDTTVGIDCCGGGIDWMRGPIVQNGSLLSQHFFSRLYFWQIAGGLSQNVGAFKPYAVGVVNQFSSTIRSSLPRMRFHNLLRLGIFEGCTVSLGTKVFLNIEARQFFESGLALTGEFRF